jgi:hypothetical protein
MFIFQNSEIACADKEGEPKAAQRTTGHKYEELSVYFHETRRSREPSSEK